MNLINLFILIFTIGGYCGVISCKESINKTNEHSQITYDSTNIGDLDAKINEINASVSQQGAPFEIPFPIYNAADTLKYWLVNNKPARISVNLIYPNKSIWPTFFVKDNELVLVRYRIWIQEYPSFAKERLIYLDNDKIVYCKERSMDLQPGDLPASLREKPFATCIMPEKELKEEYEEYWKTVSEFLVQNSNKLGINFEHPLPN